MKAFPGYAEAEATATLRSLIERAAKPALAELEALRAALDVRCESLTATLAESASIDPAPLQELIERLVHAAAEEASEAARAARQLALEEAEARVALERADAEKQLEQARAEAANERTAGRLELASLTEALHRAREEADAVRADIDAQIQAARNTRNEADAIRADRDAHVESTRVARSEAAAIRADKDAQLQAVSVASQQLDAICADRDAQIDAARIANEQADAIRADRDAQIEAARAAREQLEAVLADRHVQLQSVSVASEQLDAIRAERDAHIEAARVAQEQAEAIGADRDAQLEAARAQMTQLLADTHAQLEAACSESERRAAAHISELEALRAELEQVRAEGLRARADASRVEQPESRPVVAPAVEPVIARAAVESVATPLPVEVVSDPFRSVCLAVDEAANISQLLDGLIDGVGAVFPRAALFVVKAKAKRLQGWRSVGFTGVAAITREFEFSLATDSALTRAVNAGRMVFTGDVARDGQPAERPGEPWTVTFPVITGERVVAVVHADGGGRSGEQAPVLDREAALEISHELVRRAGVRLTALTTSAQTAFGNVLSVTPAANDTPAASKTPAVIETPAAPAAALSTASQEDAGRYASQIVSEINRYQQPAVAAQSPDPNLHERLAVDIEGSRNVHAVQAPAAAGAALGVFDEALGKMLGNDGLDARGQSEQAVAAVQPLFIVKT